MQSNFFHALLFQIKGKQSQRRLSERRQTAGNSYPMANVLIKLK